MSPTAFCRDSRIDWVGRGPDTATLLSAAVPDDKTVPSPAEARQQRQTPAEDSSGGTACVDGCRMSVVAASQLGRPARAGGLKGAPSLTALFHCASLRGPMSRPHALRHLLTAGGSLCGLSPGRGRRSGGSRRGAAGRPAAGAPQRGRPGPPPGTPGWPPGTRGPAAGTAAGTGTAPGEAAPAHPRNRI